jgi:peptide/nickel transport system substrate-binding protein
MDAGVLFSESAAAAGINLNVVREPNDGYWSNVWMQKPFAGTYWGGRPTEDWMFATAYAEGVPWNETYWSNERFNELLLGRARNSTRISAARCISRCSRSSRTKAASSSRCSPSMSAPIPTRSAHPDQVAGNWRNDGHRIGERWWFTA